MSAPAARQSDPSTSHAAAKSVEPVAGLLEQFIVAACEGLPSTAEAIARRIEHGNPGRWDEGTIRSAVSRAAHAGVIVVDGTGITSRPTRPGVPECVVKRTNEPLLWAVQVRRTEVSTVYVKHANPVVARAIALREASEWDTTVTAIACPLEGRPDDRVWTDDGWVYPETTLEFGGAS